MLLVLALVVAVTSVGLLALDRDPYLGYTSASEITRAFWWWCSPGVGLLLAVGTWSVVRLLRSSLAKAEGRSARPMSTACGGAD